MDYDYKGLTDEVTRRGLNLAESVDDWTKCAMAFSELGEAGRPLFHSVASVSDKYRQRENELKFNNALRTTQRVGIASFIYLCKQHGIDTNKYIVRDDTRSARPLAEQKALHATPATDRVQPIQVQRERKQTLCTVSPEYVWRSLDYSLQSNLQAAICCFYNDAKAIQETCLNYALGVTKDQSAIYWMIDPDGKVRSGKIMQYDPYTCKRIRLGKQIEWVHTKLQKLGVLPSGWHLTQCFFGAHLLNPKYGNEGKKLALVESEKSAIICALVFPEYVWLACGGISNLEAGGKHEVLRGRKVVMFPDTDTDGETFRKWREKAERWQAMGINATVSDVLERNATDEEKACKIDIADWLIKDLRETYAPTPIEESSVQREQTDEEKALAEICKKNPCVQTLINKLNLEIAYDVY